MRKFFQKLFRNLAEIFWGYNLLWQGTAILITYIVVISGIDWKYFEATRNTTLISLLFPAVILGGLTPILLPFIILGIGKINESKKIWNTSLALMQAEFLGLLVSDFWKSLTGRVPPPEIFGHGSAIDISHVFRFGILRGGVFWGWPSSHTTIAFSTAAALWMLFPKNRAVKILSAAYAFYVGIAVSVSIHWFSDFVAGVIFGTLVGIAVGKSFAKEKVS